MDLGVGMVTTVCPDCGGVKFVDPEFLDSGICPFCGFECSDEKVGTLKYGSFEKIMSKKDKQRIDEWCDQHKTTPMKERPCPFCERVTLAYDSGFAMSGWQCSSCGRRIGHHLKR